MNKNRIEAFSDGIFAIVITIMVFEIKIPHVDITELNHALLAILPKIMAYVLSFVIIGVYWVSHHNMMHFLESVDRTALWLNNLVLLTVALIPFPTALLGEYPNTTTPVVLYGLLLAAVNFSGTIFWHYSTNNSRLSKKNLNPAFVKRVKIFHSLPIFIYLFAVLMSFFSTYISYFLFIGVPLFFIIPNPLLNRMLSKPFIEN
jgi:uncharacterized membrane protein